MKRDALVSLTVLMMLLCFAPAALAGASVEVRESDSVSDVLKRNVGKKVEVILVSGERLSGKIEKVAASVVHISGLKGMDFYDAVVSLESVSAVIIRARG